jgi:hypothetical protein
MQNADIIREMSEHTFGKSDIVLLEKSSLKFPYFVVAQQGISQFVPEHTQVHILLRIKRNKE